MLASSFRHIAATTPWPMDLTLTLRSAASFVFCLLKRVM